MCGRLEVGISGWDEDSHWAMCLKKASSSLFTWHHLHVSQEQKEKSQNVYSVFKSLLCQMCYYPIGQNKSMAKARFSVGGMQKGGELWRLF